MRALFVASEVYPLAKTGRLADVGAALQRALAGLGVDIRLMMPGYPGALAAAVERRVACELHGFAGQEVVRLVSARTPHSGLPIWLVDCPALFAREGGPYQDEQGRDWGDNAERFALLSRAAAGVASGRLVSDWRADVVHANDWHTGLLPLYLHATPGPRVPSLFTVHNLAFQGLVPVATARGLGVADELLTPDGIEFFGQASFLKAGLRYGDGISTVSPTYAREILTPEHGCGLDGLLRTRAEAVTGILNGVDYDIWDPLRGEDLPATFHAEDLAGKHACKAELQRELGLPVDPHVLLIVWNSRITHQKMADVALEILPALLQRNVQVALAGQGEAGFEQAFRDLARAYPERLAVRIGYAEPFAHRLNAGGDLLLHPSRFEPCGLSPLYALRYGTLPLVRAVGGLIDTIVHASDEAIRAGHANGFAFAEPSAAAMLDCLDQALDLYEQPVLWRRVQQRAMTQDFGWDTSARRYLEIYRGLTSAPAATANAEPADAADRKAAAA